MSNQIKSFVTQTVEEEGQRQFSGNYSAYVTPAYSALVEAVADRVADEVQSKAQALVERVREEYDSTAAEYAKNALTEAGFLAEPEPEPEPEVEESADVTTEALDQSRLSALEAFVEEIRPLIARAKAYLGA